MADTFDLGDRPRIRTTFVDLTGIAGDPAVVIVQARSPAASGLATLVATHVATGVWDAFLNLDAAGTWGVRAVGTGGLQASTESIFTVRRSEVL